MTRRRPHRGLPGYTLLVAISITALVFTAVMGLTVVVLLTLKGGANVRAANAAFYAAEGGVERALYGLAGHGPGFETISAHPARADYLTLLDPPATETDLADQDGSGRMYLQPVLGGGGPSPAFAYVVRSRGNVLPATTGSVLEIRDHSSVSIPLSIDTQANPLSAKAPAYSLDTAGIALTVTVDATVPLADDAAPDYRINRWKGQSSDCVAEAAPTGPSPTAGTPANCPGFAEVGIVAPDDPDVGTPTTPFIFASRACDELAGECAVKWVASGPFQPIGAAAAGGRHLILRDMDEFTDGYGAWSEPDTYLIADPPAGPAGSTPRGWPVSTPYSAADPIPAVGAKMLAGDGSWLGAAAIPAVPLTRLESEDVVYLDGATTVDGTLSATGPATGSTSPDDYLYVDTGDGVVSAPWNIEITFTKEGPDMKVLRRRLRLDGSDVDAAQYISGAGAEKTIDLDALFNKKYATTDPGRDTSTLADFLAGSDARMTITSNARPLQVRVALPPSVAADLASAPDEKTVITVLGVNGGSRQTLQTTVYQEETLPVFRKTTVF